MTLDLETTGLTRHDAIISAGLLIAEQPYVLFVRSKVIPNISLAQLRQALAPLATRTDLTLVGHNLGFDLGFLHREGLKVNGVCHCTELLLRLLDSDRGKNKDVLSARIDRLAPPGSPRNLNYKLKDVVPQLLGLRMVGYNHAIPMNLLPYNQHVTYLTSDLIGTFYLYKYLLNRATPEQLTYNSNLISPLIPLLVELSEVGVMANPAYLAAETARLQDLLATLSEAHRSRFGPALGMDQRGMCAWLFGELGLRPLRFKRPTPRDRLLGRRGAPALDTPHLESLRLGCTDLAAGSLDLIIAYRRTATLLVGLAKLQPYIDHHDGRIHTALHPRQATGRISSTGPNLQGIARPKTIAGEVFRSRNALLASEGFVLVTCDIKNADIRMLADAIAQFPRTAFAHLRLLHQARLAELRPRIRPHLERLAEHRNPAYKAAQTQDPPTFDPARPDALRAILADPGADIYESAARRVLGRDTVTPAERTTFKAIVLSLSNSMGAQGLARKLGCSTSEAQGHMDAFWAAFPQVFDYLELMRHQVALTGTTHTWAGRPRVCTAHHWMVSQPRVEILISFACGEWYWLDVVPLRPGRRCLTCWIRRAWDAAFKSSNHGRLIYEDYRGELCTRPYRLFRPSELLYKLPVRNVAWRSIRRVRTISEEAPYHGFDATARSLINFGFQGGTADVAKTMMLRALPLCSAVGARMLLQIHDELVFEVPQATVTEFVARVKTLLEAPPAPEWLVPIRVEAKVGSCFGEMQEVKDIYQ